MDISSAKRALLSILPHMLTHEMGDIRARLRATRLALGWSLKEFENHSAGEVTAIAMGSYERGERTLSISKLLTICEIFHISIIHILAPPAETNCGDTQGRHIYDLRALQMLAQSPEKAHLLSYIHHIIRERGDWKGAVISLRATDIKNLTLIFATTQVTQNRDYQSWVAMQGISLQKY